MHCTCLLLTQSGHWPFALHMSAYDPKADIGEFFYAANLGLAV